MTAHLLAISIGPVQDFIAAARRTRDLSFGSFLLSEVSKAAAWFLADRAGLESLIFPAPSTPEELKNRQFNCANVILVLLPEGIDPASCAGEARQRTNECWRQFANEAARTAGDLIIDEIWKDQVDDVLEFYAAWVPLPSEAAYSGARRQVMRLLAARKACRDFQSARGRAGVAKSSLDGARESVLRRGTKGSSRLPLATGEQLDVVGLTKRLACTGDQDISYPSVARIAAASWLRLAERSPLIQDLKNECEILAQRGILSRTKDERFRTFPYDGTAIFRSRYRSIANEADVSLDMLDALRSVVKRLDGPPGDGGLGEPSPYLAILIADGDGMGAIISRLPSPEAHRAFSNSLSSFAAKAHEIVANAGGVCIYAGGDDVLAFMPLEVALSCARQLHEAFETILSGAGGLTQVPTLSVGVAVGHFMEPLEDLRDYALQAESAAKQRSGRSADLRDSEGNGLAIHVYVRSGGSLRVRERWQLGEDCLDRRLERWSGLFASKGLPGKLPYDFRKLASEYLNWPPGESLQVALAADAWRLVGRKQFQLEKADQDWFQARLDSLEAAKDLERLADQMLVAQWLAGVAAPSQTSSRSDEVLA